MKLLLALLLGNAAANPLISLVSKAKSLVTAKNLQLGGGIGAALPVLNTLREAASDAEDKRQGIKETIRSKARKTAEYVVWYHRNSEETKTGYCTKDEFCKMLSMARPIMQKKMKKRGRLARWLTTTPSEELVEIYVREEIGEVMKEDEITLEVTGQDEYCQSWTKEADAKVAAAEKKAKEAEKKEAAVGWSWPGLFGTAQAPEEPAEPEAPEGKKVVKRILLAVASALVGVALLPFK